MAKEPRIANKAKAGLRGPPPEEAAGLDPFYIQAASPRADERSRVLKHGDTFALFNHYGDISPTGLGEEGLYHEGTRYLSGLLLGLGHDRPLFLSSTVRDDNDLLAVDLTNPDVSQDGRIVIPRGTLHIARTKFLWQGACYERIRVRNFGLEAITTSVWVHFQADFADIFEVRGTRRSARGEYLPAQVEDGLIVLAYRGLDGVSRRTRLSWSPRPAELSETQGRLDVALPPRGEMTFDLVVACEHDDSASKKLSFDVAIGTADSTLQYGQYGGCLVRTSNEHFDEWLTRSGADLHMLTTETPSGPYPYAGVPWFSTAFGRDGILTALECLWLAPNLARGVLRFLADTQATHVNPEQDAEPGKILHETRLGEMAALHEIPFGRYYGSVDATPLFAMLAGAYYERTGDRDFIDSIWPNVEAALRWLDTYGDPDHDGFVEYHRRSPHGLVHQGWKDSHDSIFHADGTLADGPIALCEVQGYTYAAKMAGANLAAVLGREAEAQKLRQQAEALRLQFEKAFWCEDLGTYAIALDGRKQPCRVRTSNAGHCLLTGIASSERARRVAEALLGPDVFSGWGVRTVAASELRFNPMSYHNGSIWPHDNALIGLGLARYRLKQGVLKILTGMFDASTYVDLHRLPELFCGFARRSSEGPTRYPVACAPQAWSAAAVSLLLQACLGLSVHAVQKRLRFSDPVLPEFLGEVHIHNLDIGEASVDLRLVRHENDVGIHVLRREGHVEIVMEK